MSLEAPVTALVRVQSLDLVVTLTRVVTVSLLSQYAKSVARKTICAPPQGVLGDSNVASVRDMSGNCANSC